MTDTITAYLIIVILGSIFSTVPQIIDKEPFFIITPKVIYEVTTMNKVACWCGFVLWWMFTWLGVPFYYCFRGIYWLLHVGRKD